MRARRALLYMPGVDWRKMEKAAGLDLDSACLDLEDGVAPERKAEARQLVVKALGELDFGRTERLVRVNAVDSGLAEEDLNAVLPARPDGIVLPKVADADQLRAVAERIAIAEMAQGQAPGSIALLAQIESAMGLVNLKEIAASRGLSALVFGAEDYAGDLGAVRTADAEEVFYARSAVVAHAAAFGLQAIDMLWSDFKDAKGLKQLAAQGARLGYSGMQVIHPDQVALVQAAFTPSDDEVNYARKVIAAYEAHAAEGTGAFALDGKMVDMPMVKAARRVLARAGMGRD
jgi:citrate lyase beta subunit